MSEHHMSWWDVDKADPKKVAETFNAQCATIESEQSWRKEQALSNVSDYLGREVHDFSELIRYDRTRKSQKEPRPPATFIMQAVRTSVARIAGRQRPKCIVQTSGANYITAIQSRKRTKFLEGVFTERQGEFQTVYDLGITIFRDQEVFGEGVVKVQANAALKKVEYKRKFPWLVFFDLDDSKEGYANAVYEKHENVDVELLCKSNPELKADIYRNCHAQNGTTLKCTMWEGYSKPSGPDEPGRHLIVLGDCVLLDEPWERDTFPYCWQIGERHFFGQYGMSNIAFTREYQQRAAKIFDDCYETTDALSGGAIQAEKGAYTNDKGMNSLISRKKLKYVEHNSGFQPAKITFPEPYNSDTLALGERMVQFVMQTYAVSEFMAQGKKEPGINSAIGLRNMNELQDLNFLPKALMYERWYAELGTQTLHVCNDMVKKDGVSSLRALLPNGNGFLESIDWKSIDIGGESLYTVTVKPASSAADEYSAKLELVGELQQAGYIDSDTASRLTTSLNPDIEATMNRVHGQYNWMERIISNIWEAKDPKGDQPLAFEGPDPFMNLLSALKQMKDAYVEINSYPDAPPKKTQAMRTFMKQTIELIKRGEAAAEPPTAPPGAMAPPGVPPGAPPGAPPMGAMPPTQPGAPPA